MTKKFIFQSTPLSKLADHYDLLVIGSGGTGLTAALQAKELGANVAILEKMDKIGGNTTRASSGMNAAETDTQLQQGIIDSYQVFYQDTYRGGGQLNNQELLRYFTSHAALAIDWLAGKGIVLNDLTITGGMSLKRTHRPSSRAPIGGYLVTGLLKKLAENKIPLFTNVQVNRLLQAANGTVNGVTAMLPTGTNKKISASAVILATGGFGASHQLLQKFRPDLADYPTTNQPGATGDGISLAQAVGGGLIDMDQVQVHPTVQQETDHAYLIGEAVRGEGAILVAADGKRFVNELDTRKNVTNAINQLPTKSAYLIFDSRIRQHVKAVDFYDQIGLVKHGATLAQLAAEIKIAPKNLVATVTAWNQQVADQQDSDFGRTTGMERDVSVGPFLAIHIAPAVHYTMGGVRINHQAQVLKENGTPLLGLFAGGEVAGGLHGNNRLGGNSIAETVVFGRQAGQQACKYLKQLN